MTHHNERYDDAALNQLKGVHVRLPCGDNINTLVEGTVPEIIDRTSAFSPIIMRIDVCKVEFTGDDQTPFVIRFHLSSKTHGSIHYRARFRKEDQSLMHLVMTRIRELSGSNYWDAVPGHFLRVWRQALGSDYLMFSHILKTDYRWKSSNLLFDDPGRAPVLLSRENQC